MADLATKVEGTTGAIHRAAAESRARASGEPDWLRDFRLRAWKVYEETPLPTTRLEEWRYTRIDQLKLDEVRLLEPSADSSDPSPPGGLTPEKVEDDVPGGAHALIASHAEAAGRMLQVGASIVFRELSTELERKGVILMDLARAAREHPELVRSRLGGAVPAGAGKFQALNAALWTGGVLLYVPRGVRLESPVRVGRWLDEAGVAIFPRTLIVAEEGSQVAYVDEFASPDLDAPSLSCGAVEVFAEEGAQVRYVALQNWGRGMRHLSLQRTLARRDANLDSLIVNLGGTVARVDMAASLEGPGARSDMLGLYFGHDDQHFDHNTRQDHVSDHANSDLLYKGALYDRSRAVFRGIIKVFKGAQRTDAYQTNRNLLLSERARADSLPNLEIEADDVRCSHGATVGHLDEEELFYLMSRGLSRQAAERLVVFGFLGEVLDRLPLPGVVEEVRGSIERKIGWHHG